MTSQITVTSRNWETIRNRAAPEYQPLFEIFSASLCVLLDYFLSFGSGTFSLSQSCSPRRHLLSDLSSHIPLHLCWEYSHSFGEPRTSVSLLLTPAYRAVGNFAFMLPEFMVLTKVFQPPGAWVSMTAAC